MQTPFSTRMLLPRSATRGHPLSLASRCKPRSKRLSREHSHPSKRWNRLRKKQKTGWLSNRQLPHPRHLELWTAHLWCAVHPEEDMLKKLRKSLIWYVFIAPTFLLYGLFVAYPTFETFRLSFFHEVATRQEFIGALHYVRLLSNQVFLAALLNTAFLGIIFLLII